MKTITLTQPWATLVAIGAKRIETRSWYTLYRGALAIHAAKGFPDWCMDLCAEEPFKAALAAAGIQGPVDLPRGAVIAIGKLRGCRLIVAPETEAHLATVQLPPTEPERSFGDYTPGRYAWILEDVVQLPAAKRAKGALGLWNWKED